jgi:hypothetical protein
MSNSLSLYNLNEQYQALFSQLYDRETGEVDEKIEAQVNELLPTIEKKCINVANWIKKLEAEKREIEYLETEIQKRKEAYTGQIDRWQDYLKINMERSGLKSISCPYFTLRIKTNPYSTEVFDEFQVPGRFMKVREVKRIESKPDKEAIKKEVLETGVQVPGARVEQKTKLEISINKI